MTSIYDQWSIEPPLFHHLGTSLCVCECVSVRKCVCAVSYMLRCEEDEARGGRHPLGLDLWKVLVTSNHHTVHIGDGAPC